MKKIVLALLIIFSIATLASADVLLTASPIGAGKWAVLGAGRYDMNSQANSNMYGAGGFVGYGIMDKLDVYAKIGYGILANPVAGLTANGISLGIAGKYTFLTENNKDMPVSLAGVLGYQADTSNFNFTGFPTTQTVRGDIGGGIIVSKMMIPWIPYFAAIYHNLAQNPGAATGSRIEAALGTYMALSKASAIVGEFSYNSYSMAGTTWTNNQISLAYSQKI